MRYKGKYEIFDPEKISTYPIKNRTNKVTLDDILDTDDVLKKSFDVSKKAADDIDIIADAVILAAEENKPVIIFTGAHLVKNGLSSLLIELIKRNFVTLVAGNCATAIHDFELALIGQTSENVPQALGKGQFGMSYEFSYINAAVSLGNKYKLGYGESLGKMISDKDFCDVVLDIIAKKDSPGHFLYPHISVLATCYENNVPFTVHAGIGTDVIDQHPSFDGCAKGACSATDFLILTQMITKLTDGGVILNIGTAVTGPEVLLKAFSMAANVGKVPDNIITADFDLRIHNPKDMTDESAQCYYFRDQKSVVTRIPQAFGGKGYYVQGDQKQTIPLLYKKIIEYYEGRSVKEH